MERSNGNVYSCNVYECNTDRKALGVGRMNIVAGVLVIVFILCFLAFGFMALLRDEGNDRS